MLSVTPKTLGVWRRKGIGPAFINLLGRYRYSLATITEYIEGQTVQAASVVGGQSVIASSKAAEKPSRSTVSDSKGNKRQEKAAKRRRPRSKRRSEKASTGRTRNKGG